MRFQFPAALLLALAILPFSNTLAQGVAATSGKKKIHVAFNMAEWKAKHIHDDAAAKQFVETLKTLGCEVKQAAHNGHTDVSCRTQTWKALALDSSEQAIQWVKWLQDSGFQTIYGRKYGSHKKEKQGKVELVQYRLSEWKASHIHDKRQLLDLTALYRGLGCEMEQSGHAGHTDLKVRCQEWMEFEVGSHAIANTWLKYLASLGFETKHEH
ncbi:MAG: hypothetical protein AAF483_10530 [Planctomycetota bacterium]